LEWQFSSYTNKVLLYLLVKPLEQFSYSSD
jgi:hypothetical protein